MTKIKLRGFVAAVAVTAAALGGAVTTGPEAAAASCNPWAQKGKTTTAVKLRSNHSTSALALGVLSKNTRVTANCIWSNDYSRYLWYRVKVTTGANNGRTGWIYGDYFWGFSND
ncbi:SH3 domain-containing protein [Streptomyces sp. NBC_01462]|uniref:SH3 domain-containing protein n=1 Tax=Streptomyces sp. NBC_01462 TaxID=2903876 RepID=UPI002E36FA5C|nr:SH3 domain-containing protein [Streptomyces sp. NBC_01462]